VPKGGDFGKKGSGMSIGTLLGIIALIIGVLVGADVLKLWMVALDWFVLAIALVVVLGGVGFGNIVIGKKE
jgi:hypothetical protein